MCYQMWSYYTRHRCTKETIMHHKASTCGVIKPHTLHHQVTLWPILGDVTQKHRHPTRAWPTTTTPTPPPTPPQRKPSTTTYPLPFFPISYEVTRLTVRHTGQKGVQFGMTDAAVSNGTYPSALPIHVVWQRQRLGLGHGRVRFHLGHGGRALIIFVLLDLLHGRVGRVLDHLDDGFLRLVHLSRFGSCSRSSVHIPNLKKIKIIQNIIFNFNIFLVEIGIWQLLLLFCLHP